MTYVYSERVLVSSYCEYRTAAIYHECTSLLQLVDRVQESFLAKISIDDVTALCNFNLAPSSFLFVLSMGVVPHTLEARGD